MQASVQNRMKQDEFLDFFGKQRSDQEIKNENQSKRIKGNLCIF
jgi:hypothetical protein